MGYKNTLAIIGVANTFGSFIAKNVDAGYRLLLMDPTWIELFSLQKEILKVNPGIEVHILNCCKEASWQADIIVVNIDDIYLEEIVKKMQEVSTCKPVMHFINSEQEADRLQQLLPHAKVVSILVSKAFTNVGYMGDLTIYGTDENALAIAKDFTRSMKETTIETSLPILSPALQP